MFPSQRPKEITTDSELYKHISTKTADAFEKTNKYL